MLAPHRDAATVDLYDTNKSPTSAVMIEGERPGRWGRRALLAIGTRAFVQDIEAVMKERYLQMISKGNRRRGPVVDAPSRLSTANTMFTVSDFLSVSLPVPVCLHLCHGLSVCLCASASLSLCLSLSLSVSLYLSLSESLSI